MKSKGYINTENLIRILSHGYKDESQKDIADALGVNPMTVRRYDKGEGLTPRIVNNICRHFQCHAGVAISVGSHMPEVTRLDEWVEPIFDTVALYKAYSELDPDPHALKQMFNIGHKREGYIRRGNDKAMDIPCEVYFYMMNQGKMDANRFMSHAGKPFLSIKDVNDEKTELMDAIALREINELKDDVDNLTPKDITPEWKCKAKRKLKEDYNNIHKVAEDDTD